MDGDVAISSFVISTKLLMPPEACHSLVMFCASWVSDALFLLFPKV